MNKTSIITFFVSTILTMGLTAMGAGSQFDSLSSGTINGQNRWHVSISHPNSIVVENTKIYQGQKAIEFKTGGRKKLSKWVKQLPSGDIWIRFSLNIPKLQSSDYILFTIQTRKYKNLVQLSFRANGAITNGPKRLVKTLQGHYKIGQWNMVGIILHRKAMTMDLYINGKPTDISVAWLNQKKGKIGQPRIINFEIKNKKPTYLGNFIITSAPRQITVNLNRVRKNLSDSYLGVTANDYDTMKVPVSYQWLITKGKKQFSKWCQETGIKFFRLMHRHGWSFHGEKATKMVHARISAHRAVGHPKQMKKRYESAMHSKRSIWYDPVKMYDFCKANGIVTYEMFGSRAFYDVHTKQAVWVANQPKYYDAAAANAASFVKWIKDHGYLNTVKAWEIGNETYWFWKPKEYAAYVKKIIAATRKVDPNIKLAVSMYYRRQGDPDAAWYKNKNASQRVQKAMAWVRPMFKALGPDAKYITYGVVHLYGAESAYNTNYKGLESYVHLIHSIPNAKHLRLTCDEWRGRATENLTIQRRYDIGALWKTKFSLLLMAQPLYDYSGILSMFRNSGLGAYSDGHRWFTFQVHADGSPVNAHKDSPFDYLDYMPNPSGKRLALGPYAASMRMCNGLIETDPLMLEHHMDLGKMASAKFYESRRDRGMNGSIKGGEGLEWLIATNADRTSLAAIIVNTKPAAQHLRFVLPSERRFTGKATIEAYTCAPDKVGWTSTPGSISPKYDHGYLQDVTTTQPAGQVITVPAFSVVKVVIPIKK